MREQRAGTTRWACMGTPPPPPPPSITACPCPNKPLPAPSCPRPRAQVLTNAYINQVPAVSMTFKQKNAGLDSLAVSARAAARRRVACVRTSPLSRRPHGKKGKESLGAQRCVELPWFEQSCPSAQPRPSSHHPLHLPPLHLPPPLLQCMVGKCGGQIFRCVTDPTCKAALDCLQGCEFNDQARAGAWALGFRAAGQTARRPRAAARESLCTPAPPLHVCLSTVRPPTTTPIAPLQVRTHRCVTPSWLEHIRSLALPQVCTYRCITSYESPLLEDFSLWCVCACGVGGRGGGWGGG